MAKRYEPMPRFDHVSAQVGSKVIVHSGLLQDSSQQSQQRLKSAVEVFDIGRELWEAEETTGESPAPGTYGAVGTSLSSDLFTYGGEGGRNHKVSSLHRLDTKTYHWYKLSPRSAKEESPMAKSGAGMVAYGDNLALFAGHGIPHGPTQPGSSFIRDTDGSGWTNEFHIYRIDEDVWNPLESTGEKPPPCSAFTFTSVDHRRAVMFGGYVPGQQRVNNAYIIDLQSMHWTKLKKSRGPWPGVRNDHAACCLNYGQELPQLLITGGRGKDSKLLSDAWILDVDRGRWRKVSDTLLPHCGHSASAISLSSGLVEVIMFGGFKYTGGKSVMSDTTLLQFRLRGDTWKLSGMVGPSDLGQPEERLREKAKIMKASAQEEEDLKQGLESLEVSAQIDGRTSTNEKAAPKKNISFEIDLSDLKFEELLGQGTFGAVFRGRWVSKGFDVALKKVNCTPDTSDAQIMMELGKHPNIISFYGFAYNFPETIIVTALARNGSLYNYLHIKKEKPTTQQSLSWAKQIAYGMTHMHMLNYIHRDLKSSNILFSNDMAAQVCDFGTARFLKGTTFASSVAGTPHWMAPEVARNDAINKQCDVFSFSLIVWEMMEHKIPYGDAPSDIMASVAIMSGKRPPIGAGWPDYLSSLTQACWAPTPNDRPTFSDIVTSLENKTFFKQ